MSHFHESLHPEDLPPHHHGTDDRDPHRHVCACGVWWICSKPDCSLEDACQRCEDDALTTYLDARQPVLEPETALIGGRDDN